MLSGLVIIGFLSYLFFQNNKPNDKYLAAAADSVAVDTTSAFIDNAPPDSAAPILGTESELSCKPQLQYQFILKNCGTSRSRKPGVEAIGNSVLKKNLK